MLTQRTIPFRRIIQIFVILLAAQPFLALSREALRIPAAVLAQALSSSGIVEQVLGLFRLSQIQTDMMVKALGSTQPQGVAVVGVPGDLLHSVFPAFFLEPGFVACGALVSTVIHRGGSIVGYVFTGALADSLLLGIGTILVRLGIRNSSIAHASKYGGLLRILLLGLGLVVQVQAAWAILSAFQRPKVVEDLGGNFLVGLLSDVGSQQYTWLLYEFLPSAIPLAIITAVVIGALLVWNVSTRIRRAFLRDRRLTAPSQSGTWNRGILLLAQVVVILIAQSFPPYFGMARTSMLGVAGSSVVCSRAARDYYAAPSAALASRATPPSASSRRAQVSLTPTLTPTAIPTAVKFPQVRLARQADRFKFLIDNKPFELLGINYNVDYSRLPVSRQRARHSQDFQLLAARGFKVMTGWGIFNETTLETADKYGTKVIMPIELDPTKVYGNPAFRGQALGKLVSTVERFQNFPAVIMWNPGGDEFLAYVDQDLLNRSVSEDQRKIVIQDMTDLLVEMAQLAYRTDKYKRPSVIKQVHDWYIDSLAQSLEKVRQSGDEPSAFVVYGADVYGWPDYIAPILARVQTAVERLGLAWLVTEFGPVGTGQVNRASGYVEAFRLIKQTTSLGAMVYVFAPDLPDPVLARPLSLFTIQDDPDDDAKRQLTPVDSTLQDLGDEFLRARPE